MFKLKTASFAAMLILLTGTALADPPPASACPKGEYNASYPGIPIQCVECAAPGCPACHNERTDKTVAATKEAQENCPKVKPH